MPVEVEAEIKPLNPIDASLKIRWKPKRKLARKKKTLAQLALELKLKKETAGLDETVRLAQMTPQMRRA